MSTEYICNGCDTVFDADDLIQKHTNKDIIDVCPECGSEEIEEAMECDVCGEMRPVSKCTTNTTAHTYWDPPETSVICDSCSEEAYNTKPEW